MTVDGRRLLLTPGQYATLLYVRHRTAGAGPTTIASMAATLGTQPGRIVERLDRLTSLGLVGRRSIVGRGHRTLLWIPARGRLAHGAARWRIVRTATPFGGFLSREALERRGWRRVESSGAPPGPTRADPSLMPSAATTPPGSAPPPSGGPDSILAGRRYSRPPSLLAARCPRGHRTSLGLVEWHRGRGELGATWAGRCGHCRSGRVEQLAMRLPVGRAQPPAIGSAAWVELMVERHGAERVAWFLSLAAARDT